MTQGDEGSSETVSALSSQANGARVLNDPQQTGNRQAKTGGISRWLPLVVLAAIMAVGFSLGLHKYLTLDTLVAQRATLQAYLADHTIAAFALFFLSYVVVVAISLPGASILTILGGFLFGWLIGGIITVLAATVGATAVFLVARTSLGEALRARTGPFLGKLANGFKEDAFSYLLFLRLVPVFPFWLINLAPAFLGVQTKSFFLGTLIGIIPGTFAFAFIGSGLDSLIEAQQIASGCVPGDTTCEISLSLTSLVTGEMIAAFVALGVAALIPVVIKRFRGREKSVG